MKFLNTSHLKCLSCLSVVALLVFLSPNVANASTGAGPGAAPHVKVFDGTNNQLLKSFFAYDPAFTGGVRVASGDVNGDGLDDIITGAGPGAGPLVKAFNAPDLSVLHSFFAFEANYSGGVFVAGNSARVRPR